MSKLCNTTYSSGTPFVIYGGWGTTYNGFLDLVRDPWPNLFCVYNVMGQGCSYDSTSLEVPCKPWHYVL